jgi:hypothetical protein
MDAARSMVVAEDGSCSARMSDLATVVAQRTTGGLSGCVADGDATSALVTSMVNCAPFGEPAPQHLVLGTQTSLFSARRSKWYVCDAQPPRRGIV